MRILVVDDSSFVRSLIVKSIHNHFEGVQIDTATDGQEGLEAFKTKAPDLIVTDLLMPNMTGQAFLTAVRELHPTLPAIVVSADIQVATKEELEAIGILSFINKPLSQDKITQLITLIRGALYVD